MTCPHSNKPCANRHDCERCRVPNVYGYFLTWQKAKAVWQQRFILEADRQAIAAYYDAEIAKAQKARDDLMKIPSKEEYERSLKGEQDAKD